MKENAKPSERAQEVSCNVSRLIAKMKNPHTVGEIPILPSCKEIVRGMLGPGEEKEMVRVPLCDDTIIRRIDDISDDIEATLVDKLRVAGKFAFQVDESTDIGSCAQLIAIARTVDERRIKDRYLFCKELPQGATGDEVFHVTDGYLKSNGIQWQNCTSVCADGAAAMTGPIIGFQLKREFVRTKSQTLNLKLEKHEKNWELSSTDEEIDCSPNSSGHSYTVFTTEDEKELEVVGGSEENDLVASIS
ncbi:zinc finger BED domain-containing protein 5-like [Uloborus diversus]|uniref:zinc finger BED domain-containing protein 5-like n=1 Tax=Uloborus diversus TaxID=327109 RepID=UPI00240A4131|nr:zinc finger BED domain-containing protein 5-like [Uloborus diversus]